MNGPYGLDYGVFIMMAKDEEVKRSDRVWILEDLRLLEREYLAAFRLKQPGRARRHEPDELGYSDPAVG